MPNKRKIAVLLVNLGSPDSPEPGDVYRYLTEFLNDPRVIDISWIGRKILVNGIIVPFRHRKSAAIYQQLWTENGSPLIYWGNEVKQALQKKLDLHPNVESKVFLGMRYQNPSLESALLSVKKWNPDKIIVLPLFPHYASASTGSVIDKCMRIMRDLWVFPEITFISQFWDHPGFLDAFAERARAFPLYSAITVCQNDKWIKYMTIVCVRITPVNTKSTTKINFVTRRRVMLQQELLPSDSVLLKKNTPLVFNHVWGKVG